MIRHVLKLVWNRKRANALIIVEIFFSFLVLFGVVTAAAASLIAWNRPLGYDWRNVWTVRVSMPEGAGEADAERTAKNRDTMRRFAADIASMPEIVAVGASSSPPYSRSTWESDVKIDGRRVKMTRDFATDDFAKAMNIPILRGRWFDARDDAASYNPVVVDGDLAEDIAPGQDPIGRKVGEADGTAYRVIGVIPPFRKDGEFSTSPMNMIFERASLIAPKGRVPRNIVLKIRPGAGAEFEERLSQRLHGLGPDVSFHIRHMDALRAFAHRLYLLPIIVATIVAVFLIAMVTLGLSGVLWQNVTRRTREIGLRRAVGASGRGVRRQVFSEVAILATLAVGVGIVVVAQLPVLGIFRVVSPTAYMAGIGGALAMIYGLTLLCGAYPGWLASRLHPADALRYE